MFDPDPSVPLKLTGAQLIAFYDEWPLGGDWYHEDGMTTEDGELDVIPTEEYLVVDVLGYLGWQGHGDPPRSVTISGLEISCNDEGCPYIDEVVRAWLGTAKRACVVLIAPSDHDKLLEICAEHGWEVR